MRLTRSRARALLIAVHFPFVVVAPMVTLFGLNGRAPGDPRIVVPLGIAMLGLQLEHSIAASHDRRPRGWPCTFVVLCVVVYLPILNHSVNWASAQWFVVASAAMLLPGRLGTVFVAGPVVGTAIVTAVLAVGSWGATMPDAVFGFVFWISGLALGGACLYGAVEMVRAVDGLYAARAQLADVAVQRERQRVSRDLHDLLGQSLTAVALKGQLALAHIPTDPGAADAEIRDLTEIARHALSAMGQVTRGQHRTSLLTEVAEAARLLDVAAVRADIDVVLDDLPAPVDELLGWAVREGVTNILRHSAATRCAIVGRRDAGVIEVEVINDGADPPGGEGHGLSGLAERAAALGGEAGASRSAQDEHRLVVRVPEDVS